MASAIREHLQAKRDAAGRMLDQARRKLDSEVASGRPITPDTRMSFMRYAHRVEVLDEVLIDVTTYEGGA